MIQTIAVDFDGVVHAYSKGWFDGAIYDAPAPGAFNSIERLRRHYAVAIFTTRDVRQVAEWLLERGFDDITVEWTPPFWNDQESILVTNSKPAASVYIDDRGLRFLNWSQTMSDLDALGFQISKRRGA